MDGPIDLDTDTIRVTLVTAANELDQGAHDVKDDAANEVRDAGYSPGGTTLAQERFSGATIDRPDPFRASCGRQDPRRRGRPRSP